MSSPGNKKDATAQANDRLAQGDLALNDNLALSDEELSRRAEIANQRAQLLKLSLRDLEQLTGLGRNQVADTLKGIPSNTQYLLFVEQGIRIEAGKMATIGVEILADRLKKFA